jgi:hypothetical protein
MKTGKRYFIVYDGNLTGAEYHNDIIGVADTMDDAKQLMNDLVKEDNEIYGKMDDEIKHDLSYHAERSNGGYSYNIKEKDCYIP